MTYHYALENGVVQKNGAGAMADPKLSLCRVASEAVDVRHTEGKGVDADVADRRAADLGIGVDVDPAHIGPQGTVFADFEIETGMKGNTPGIIKADRHTGQNAFACFVPEMGVVQTQTNERRDVGIVGEVVLDRYRGRQLFCVGDRASASELDVMLERPRGQNLNADVVGDEIFKCQGRAVALFDFDRADSCGAGAVGGEYARNTETKGHIATRLGESRRGRGNKCGCKGENSNRFHCRSIRILTRRSFGRLVCRPVRFVTRSILRRSGPEDFDLDQISVFMPRCGVNATGGGRCETCVAVPKEIQ